MLPGETVQSGAPSFCGECERNVRWGVYMSGAGYYVGTMCGCGPYSRESGYFTSREAAQQAFFTGEFGRA